MRRNNTITATPARKCAALQARVPTKVDFDRNSPQYVDFGAIDACAELLKTYFVPTTSRPWYLDTQ